MSTDTYGFVTIDDKDFFRITTIIVDALTEYTVVRADVTVSPHLEYAQIHFKVRDVIDNIPVHQMEIIEHRTLHLHFNCDSDYSDIDGRDKIIWSLGHWGMAEEIIKLICKSMVGFGDVYFIADDSVEDWEYVE